MDRKENNERERKVMRKRRRGSRKVEKKRAKGRS